MTLHLCQREPCTVAIFTDMRVVHLQFLTFLSVGVGCALVDIGLMLLLISEGLHPVNAATVGFVAGLGLNFALHTKITFASQYSSKIFLKFIAVVIVNYLLTIVAVAVSFHWFGSAIAGKVVSLPIVAVNGFLLSRYWIYK